MNLMDGNNPGAEGVLMELSKALTDEDIEIEKDNIPGHTKYANKKALKLARWSLIENNRIKASKIKRAADKMEDRYRNSREFNFKKNMLKSGNNGYYPLYTKLIMSPPPPPPPPQRPQPRGNGVHTAPDADFEPPKQRAR